MTKIQAANRKFVLSHIRTALENIKPLSQKYGCVDYAIDQLERAVLVAENYEVKT